MTNALRAWPPHKWRFAPAFKAKAGPGPLVDPIEYAWQRLNPRCPFPNTLRADRGGILNRQAG